MSRHHDSRNQRQHNTYSKRSHSVPPADSISAAMYGWAILYTMTRSGRTQFAAACESS
jgi:hypothetical protein